MYDIYSSLSALKISWIKRILSLDFDENISTHLYPKLKKLNTFGNLYAETFISKLDNPFWKDVLKHFITLNHINNNNTGIEESVIREEPIHFNKEIKRDNKPICIENWIENNVVKIRDLCDENLVFYDWYTFKIKYPNLDTNFILYNGIVNSIKQYIKKIKKDERKTNICAKFIWQAVEGGTKIIRQVLNEKNTPPTSVLKWDHYWPNLNWDKIFIKGFKTSKDTQLQWFQSRILHRILPTEKYLNICKIKNSPNCKFCNDSVETLQHLLWECPIVNQFWQNLLQLIHEKCHHCTRFYFCPEIVLFGLANEIYTDRIMDFIILFAKFYIYKCKLNELRPDILSFLRQLKKRLLVEEKVSEINNKDTWFEREWKMYRRLFDYIQT